MFEPGILRTLPNQEQCANSTSHGLVLVLVEIALPPPYRKVAYDCFRGPCACIDESAADDFYRPGIGNGAANLGCAVFCMLPGRNVWKTRQHRTYKTDF